MTSLNHAPWGLAGEPGKRIHGALVAHVSADLPGEKRIRKNGA